MVRPLIAFALFFFVCNRLFFFVPGMFESAAAWVVSPLLAVQTQIFGSYKSHQQTMQSEVFLRQEIEKLKAERDQLLAQQTQWQSIQAYANSVQELLAFKNKYEQKPQCIAAVVLRTLTDAHHSILVDCGAEQGVVPDMVAVYQNQLIGRVSDVWARLSKIVLTTDKSCKVAALCVQSNVRGIHEGLCQLDQSTVSHVSHLVTVTDQDMVVSSGQGLVFPYGLAPGVVTEAKSYGMHQQVTVKPLVDIRSIEKVWILQKKT
jgi:rod shape-determining protein MreC